MKAYEAFSSWATMVTVVISSWGSRPGPSAGPDRLECGLRRETGADPDESVADRLAEGHGWLAGPTQELGRRDLSLDPLPCQLPVQLGCQQHRYHLLSFVLGVLALDVIERSPGCAIDDLVLELPPGSTAELDLRPGGRWIVAFQVPDGPAFREDRILTAVEAGVGAKAAEAMRKHLRQVADVSLLRWQPEPPKHG